MQIKNTAKACRECGEPLGSRNTSGLCQPCGCLLREARKRSTTIPTDPNPAGLCQCGCGGATEVYRRSWIARGIHAGHHRLFISGHNAARRAADIEALYVVEDRGYSTPCWTWQAAKNKYGYGRLNRAEQDGESAHRFMYRLRKGSIPEALQLDHLCRNRDCVNPDHLEPVTAQENMRRARVARQ